MHTSRVRELREARKQSQLLLAERASISRQSLSAIESGQSVPGVDVALRLAAALECSVEQLFGSAAEPLLAVGDQPASPGRAVVARIGGRWVCHALASDALSTAADGVVASAGSNDVMLEPLRPLVELEQNVIVMGCASGLGLLADRLNSSSGAGRFQFISRGSTAALRALAEQRAHVAGIHLVDPKTGEADLGDVQRLAGVQNIQLITLARWEMGLVSRSEDRRIRGASDLGRPRLRLAGREPGAGAQRLLERTLREQGLPVALGRSPKLRATGHLEVARAVALGAADTGVATRDAARALGLTFLPLCDERYDLAVPAALLADPRVERLLEVLVSAPFRRELSLLGYDVGPIGRRVTEHGST